MELDELVGETAETSAALRTASGCVEHGAARRAEHRLHFSTSLTLALV